MWLEVGGQLGGRSLPSQTNLRDVATFFRQGADANLSAFESLDIVPAARKKHVSTDTEKAAFALSNVGYAQVVEEVNLTGRLKDYFGNTANNDYAELASAVRL